jgi:uncharacterized membrane protein
MEPEKPVVDGSTTNTLNNTINDMPSWARAIVGIMTALVTLVLSLGIDVGDLTKTQQDADLRLRSEAQQLQSKLDDAKVQLERERLLVQGGIDVAKKVDLEKSISSLQQEVHKLSTDIHKIKQHR